MRLRGSWLGCRLATWVPSPVCLAPWLNAQPNLVGHSITWRAWLSSRREKPAWSVRPSAGCARSARVEQEQGGRAEQEDDPEEREHQQRAHDGYAQFQVSRHARSAGPGALPTVGADRRPRSWGRDRLAPQAVRLSSGHERDGRRDHWRNTFESWNGEALPNLRPAAEW